MGLLIIKIKCKARIKMNFHIWKWIWNCYSARPENQNDHIVQHGHVTSEQLWGSKNDPASHFPVAPSDNGAGMLGHPSHKWPDEPATRSQNTLGCQDQGSGFQDIQPLLWDPHTFTGANVRIWWLSSHHSGRNVGKTGVSCWDCSLCFLAITPGCSWDAPPPCVPRELLP